MEQNKKARSPYPQIDMSNVFEAPGVKIGLVVIVGVGVIYLLGHIFKVIAHTADGFRMMKNSIKGA